ncbi:MAG: sigma-54-dependent transcriptional regulator [Planctomycetota bacterium]
MSEDDRPLVLVVDDDAAVCWALEQALGGVGYRVHVSADAAAARRAIKRHRPDVVLTDVRMPGESGLELLSAVHKEHPLLPVVVMTAHGTMEVAVEAVQQGAFDYLPKPLELDRVEQVVALAIGEHRVALSASGDPAAEEEADSFMIGGTPAMQEVYRRIAAAAGTDIGVLITGPTGSGKELVARALHRHSPRRDGPFLAVNCGALPDNLVESELFGHEAGAFTDAKERKIGRVEAAAGGTLFLDEVGELPQHIQVKLLRFLEDQRFVRVGGTQELQADVRVVTATHRDLERQVVSGQFREDLAYRLRVLTIPVPALAERMDDLPLLMRHFLARIAERLGRRVGITDEAQQKLFTYHWPGNVRELKHCIEEAAVLATGGIIGPEHLHISPAESAPVGLGLAGVVRQEVVRLAAREPGGIHKHIIDRVEAAMIAEALARCQGNQLRAAELLGINRITLKKRMDSLGVITAG